MTLSIHYPKQAVKAFLESRFPGTDWTPVIDQLPPMVWRCKWNTYAEKYGLPYTKGYMQNLDADGCGPASFV